MPAHERLRPRGRCGACSSRNGRATDRRGRAVWRRLVGERITSADRRGRGSGIRAGRHGRAVSRRPLAERERAPGDRASRPRAARGPPALLARHLWKAGAPFSHAVGRHRAAWPLCACRVAWRPCPCSRCRPRCLGVRALAARDRFRTRRSLARMVRRGRASDSSRRDAGAGGERIARGPSARQSTRDYAITLSRLARSISYRVQSGSVKSPLYTVTVLEPPAVAEIAARVEPPAYSKFPTRLAADSSRIEALEGSKVTLEIKASRPVRSIEVEWPVEPAQSDAAATRRIAVRQETLAREGSVTVEAVRSGPYSVSMSDELGIASRPDSPRRVVVRADAPPVVAVRGPEGVRDSSANDTLALAIAARDDIAVASVELHYAIDRASSSAGDAESQHVAVALPGVGSRSARGEGSLALGSLGLKPGDSLSYRVRVADNRPAPHGPNVVWSPEQTLSIVAAAEPLGVRASRARTSGLRSRLESLRNEVRVDRAKTEELRVAADAVRRGDGEWDDARKESLADRAEATRAIEDQLKLLARELDADRGMQPLSRAAQQVALVEAAAARARLDQAGREHDAAARHTGLEQAVGRLAEVNERLDELARDFEAARREAAEIGRLNELARRQEELAAQAADDGRRPRRFRPRAGRATGGSKRARSIAEEDARLAGARPRVSSTQSRATGRPGCALADREREESRQAFEPAKHGPELESARRNATRPGRRCPQARRPGRPDAFAERSRAASTRRKSVRPSTRSSAATWTAAASASSRPRSTCAGWPATSRTCGTIPRRSRIGSSGARIRSTATSKTPCARSSARKTN